MNNLIDLSKHNLIERNVDLSTRSVLSESNSSNSRPGSDLYRAQVLAVDQVSLKATGNGRQIFIQSVSFQLSQKTSFSDFSVASVPEFVPPSPEVVAKNVLGFVDSRLKQEAADGASTERLSNLLDQAREGVSTGIGQAIDDIESMGLMTEELDEQIQKSSEYIDSGLDRMEAQYVRSEDEASKDRDGVDKSISELDQVSSREINEGYKHVAYAERALERVSSDFQLTTRDGDKISIRFLQAEYAQVEGGAIQDRGNGASVMSFSAGSTQQFELVVEGDLDDEELKAIEDLMMQLGEVSELFFSGDFSSAFEKALDVGFDASEIANFSLNLSQMNYQESALYGRNLPSNDVSAVQQFRPIAQAYEGVNGLIDTGDIFDAGIKQLQTLFEVELLVRAETEGEVSAERLSEYLEFTNQLFKAFDQD